MRAPLMPGAAGLPKLHAEAEHERQRSETMSEPQRRSEVSQRSGLAARQALLRKAFVPVGVAAVEGKTYAET